MMAGKLPGFAHWLHSAKGQRAQRKSYPFHWCSQEPGTVGVCPSLPHKLFAEPTYPSVPESSVRWGWGQSLSC